MDIVSLILVIIGAVNWGLVQTNQTALQTTAQTANIPVIYPVAGSILELYIRFSHSM